MSTATPQAPAPIESGIPAALAGVHPQRLFVASCMSLISTAVAFGVVTSFRFRLVPLGPQVMAGAAFWAADDTEALLRFYRDWIADCPDELMTIVVACPSWICGSVQPIDAK